MEEDMAAVADASIPAPDRLQALSKLVAATGASGGPEERESVGRAAMQLSDCVAGLEIRLPSSSAPGAELLGCSDSSAAGGTREKTEAELLFRLIRNACAQPSATAAFIEAGLLGKMTRAVRALAATRAPHAAFELQAAAQLLANCAATVTGPRAPRGAGKAAWEASFPGLLAALASVAKHEVQAPLCFALVSFCRGCPERSLQLSEGLPEGCGDGKAAQPLLFQLLNAVAEGQGGGADMGRLLGVLVYEHGFLKELLVACSTGEEPGAQGSCGGSPSYCVELLQELAEGAWACFGSADPAEPGRGCGRSLQALADLIRSSAREVAAKGPDARPTAEQLQMALQFLRSLTAAEENIDPVKEVIYRAVMSLMCDAGLVELMLAMIKALPPVKPAGRAASRESSSSSPPDSEAEKVLPVAETCPGLAEEAGLLPSWNVFQGYRSYLVAVVGNMAFKQGRVQDLVTDLGGVELLLAQCQIDEESPMLREWGLWAIRNLTEGSEAAQQRIRDLEVCKAADNPELRAMGKKVEYDPAAGKMNIVDSKAPDTPQ